MYINYVYKDNENLVFWTHKKRLYANACGPVTSRAIAEARARFRFLNDSAELVTLIE